MLAQFIMKSGQAVIANVEKVKIIKNGMGEIVSVEWTTPEDAYSELRYIKVSDIVAVVMIKNENTVTMNDSSIPRCSKCTHEKDKHNSAGCVFVLDKEDIYYCPCDTSVEEMF